MTWSEFFAPMSTGTDLCSAFNQCKVLDPIGINVDFYSSKKTLRSVISQKKKNHGFNPSDLQDYDVCYDVE